MNLHAKPLTDSQHQNVSRSLLLQYFPLVAVLLLDIVFLAMLDSSFTYKKRALVVDTREKHEEFFAPVQDMRNQIAVLSNRYSDQDQLTDAFFNHAKTYLENNVPTVLQEDHPWYRVVLTTKDNNIVYEYSVDEKLATFNNWQNCLFSRNFSAPVGLMGVNFMVYYTTPKGWTNIHVLVLQYWIYAILFVVATAVMHWWLSYNVFLPLQHVGRAIESMIRSHTVTIISNPYHELEFAYNEMARNQREILFGLNVDQTVDSLHSLSDQQQVIEQFFNSIILSIETVYPLRHCWAYVYSRYQGFMISLQNHDDAPVWKNFEKDTILRVDGTCWIPFYSGDQPLGGIRCEYSTLADDEVDLMANEIRRQVQNGIARSLNRSRALTEERNRFGINLATNMGHDLTNIIATGKWDLDTIQRAQNLGIIQVDPEKGRFFHDAVKGLENNLEFLQEMVNIYRSVAYMRKPQFENCDLADLLANIIELYRRSTSHNLTIQITAPNHVLLTIEPRLFRMALFNLLANACQAIQHHEPRISNGEIHVILEKMEQNQVKIQILDNGPGIRDTEGNLLPNNEIQRIFLSGYSTKGEGSGGGLGLAWVKEIVEDIHQGNLSAENRDQGGAALIVTIPLQLKEHE